MPIEPIQLSQAIKERFRRYLTTTFKVGSGYPDLAEQLESAIHSPDRLFRGPYLQGLPPYVRDESIRDLVDQDILPKRIEEIPFLSDPTQLLYSHQSQAIRRLRTGRNVVVSSGTGSGKTLCFLMATISEVLENPAPGVHTMLLYPMNALVQDQLKVMRHLLRDTPQVRFGRYVNINITPERERDARRLHPEALEHEVVSREVFREEPPHILITNFAMLEYLLLRPDDSPLFHGPWRFVVLDEAHTYSGAKGSEVALLLRRLRARTQGDTDDPIQYIATSATIGAADESARAAVARFANQLFDAPFDTADVIESKMQYDPAAGDQEPDSSIYTDPLLAKACEEKTWQDGLAEKLTAAGFELETVQEAEAQDDFEVGLYHLFQHDRRVERLRNAVAMTPDLPAAAYQVLGKRDHSSIQQLVGLVRICSLARSPESDSRLVPCRYHFFVRGLSGGYLAFDRSDERGKPAPSLFLDPVNTTPDGLYQTVELYLCRKCRQPYIFGYAFHDEDLPVLKAFGSPTEGRGNRIWFSWTPLRALSEDEEDEEGEEESHGEETVYCARCGTFTRGKTGTCECGEDRREVRLWLIKEGDAPQRCFACGGNNTITPLRADADAAQAVVAESFYRYLPESEEQKALYYPGKGRKLLCFADSRQQAAYFAPYLESTHKSQKMKWLLYNALNKMGAGARGTDPQRLISYMEHLAQEEQLFSEDQEMGLNEECAVALVVEFCLPVGRRQSLEALGLLDVTVNLPRAFESPTALSELGLTQEEQEEVIQVLLASLRMQKAITLPPPLVPNREEFEPKKGIDAVVAKDSDRGAGFRLLGFVPVHKASSQRRSAYLEQVLQQAAIREGKAPPSDEEVKEVLFDIWQALVNFDGPANMAPMQSVEVAPGKKGFQIRWNALRIMEPQQWHLCPECNQWTAHNVLGVCPSFKCEGHLITKDPADTLGNNHYRHIYQTEAPVPLVAKEHTAQLTADRARVYQQAFQEGHSQAEGQINILSCSTTFELGVDLGDLEAVFMRGIPPTPTNYQQRAGRAGRGVGKAAFVVSFALPRPHDEHYFPILEEMVSGVIVPPQINLSNEIIIKRHVYSVLLADFVRSLSGDNRHISQLFEGNGGERVPIEAFFSQVGDLIDKNRQTLEKLKPAHFSKFYIDQMAQRAVEDISAARDHYFDEIRMFEDALQEAKRARSQYEREGKYDNRVGGYMAYLGKRIKALREVDWVSFFSDRGVLPSYAFPIYNVTLETSNPELNLGRDLRIALSEYVPGAAVVADERLWRSVGIKLPPKKALEAKYYAKCPQCWHVQRHLKKEEVFKGRNCPICGHDGRKPKRNRHLYMVPRYGFTTDVKEGGEKLSFNRPQRIPTSRVLFVPQQEADDSPVLSIGQIEVRTTDSADFFVFNDGEDVRGKGFFLCKQCGRAINPDDQNIPHQRPFGGECRGRGEWKHLGHEFRGSAARVLFTQEGHEYTDHGFWLSLMYAFLGGMSEALGIERNDINGIIRPVKYGDQLFQEIVLFDDVPGGAGHVKRLESQEEFLASLRAAFRRVSNCKCGIDASCYRCLRDFRNQFFHDILQRKPVVEYLDRLLSSLTFDEKEDVPYTYSDKARMISALIDRSVEVYLIADELTETGPDEIGPWHILLQRNAARIGNALRIGLRRIPTEWQAVAPILLLKQAGAQVRKLVDGAPLPAYAVMGITAEGNRTALHWGEEGAPLLDSATHLKRLWQNRNSSYLAEKEAELGDWFEQNTEEVAVFDLIQTGYKTHIINEGDEIDYQEIFGSGLRKGIQSICIQDPYLRNPHQLSCLERVLSIIHPFVEKDPIELKLTTKLANQEKDRYAFPAGEHRGKIGELFARYPGFELKLDMRGFRDMVHARFIFITGPDEEEKLFYLDRGIDIVEPRSGKARGCPILEFDQPEIGLKKALSIGTDQ
jgi:hypothetical protein